MRNRHIQTTRRRFVATSILPGENSAACDAPTGELPDVITLLGEFTGRQQFEESAVRLSLAVLG